MASSSDNEHHGSQHRPQPLARQNSSFIGAIKNIVRAPLNWFANQDEHTATPGKRRRPLEQQATEEFDSADDSELGRLGQRSEMQLDRDDEGMRSSKRIRLRSPPRQHYLDPPTASLRRTAPPHRSSIIPRAASAMLPSSADGRSTLSPRRQFATARTMSIDPPSRALSSHESAFNFGPPPSSAESDYEMAVDSNGDWSVPPSPRRSPRPSFRMRSSVTPQPHFTRPPLRYISEPPLLNSLVSKPTFIQPPTQTLAPLAETATLGSLVESAKVTKSPTKLDQSPSLFSSSQAADGHEEKDAASERALHQLDVYKTPLLPSRMRSSDASDSLTANRTPEMFTSRRRKRLELMSEERERTSKREGKGPVTNETKPYAGDGALRKLLARRKQESTEEEQPKHQQEARDTGLAVTSNPIAPTSTTDDVPPLPEVPVPTGPDLFAPSTTPLVETGSSFRVGRTISTRKHINRPSPLQRPSTSTSKFSAVYEDDGDDAMGEATKADPVPQLFSEPVGFTFAKDVQTAGPDHSAELENAKEPPLTSLPFSFAKPAVVEKPTSAPEPKPLSFPASGNKTTSDSSLFGGSHQSSNLFNVPKPAPAQSTTTGIPNFFASSTLIKETPMPAAPVLSFPAATATKTPTVSNQVSSGSDFFALKPKPVDSTPKVHNDKENPFWVNSSDKPVVDGTKAFGGFGRNVSAKSVTEVGISGDPTSSSGFLAPSQAFSFEKPVQPDPPSSSSAKISLATEKASEVAPKPFSFNTPSVDAGNSQSPPVVAAASSSNSDMPAVSGSVFGESKSEAAAPSLFQNLKPVPQTSNLFAVPPTSSGPPTPFTFDTTSETSRAVTPTFSSTTTAPTSTQPNFFATPATQPPSSEPPKSLFNASPAPTGAFSFGQTPPASVDKSGENKAFTFGATTTKTSDEANKSSMFSFGQSTPSSSTPIAPAVAASAPAPAFSFSGGPGTVGSPSADVSNKQFFMFGQSTPASTPQRPVTPPKSVDNEFMMEESPTRDLQQANKAPEARPSLGGGAFSFGNSSTSNTGSVLFGNTAGSSSNGSPFSFGTSAQSNPFAQKSTKPEEPSTFGGFGQSAAPVAPPIQTSFSFGQSAKSPEPQRPHTAGGFAGFGTTPTSATAATPAPFTFGASTTPSSNPFGQPTASTSAPSSPSFNASNPFSFGTQTAASTGAFTFGSSQPASPASGGNLSLPPSGFGNTGGFGQSAQQPPSPFGAPALLAPSTSSGGGSGLFTIGAPPPQNAQTGRTIKKLPNRRGGVKR